MKREVANALLDIKAVSLKPNDPFTWASGIKSPIYCDNRFILSFPEKRNIIVEAFVKTIKESYPDVEMLFGTSTAGIPWASLVADRLGLPMGYVRGDNKDHGKKNQIEGHVVENTKVVVIEDLISTGGSVKTVIEPLLAAKQEVLGVVAIFTYELAKASKLFEEMNISYKTLSNYSTLIEEAVKNNYVSANDLAKLKEWKKDPSNEEWMNK